MAFVRDVIRGKGGSLEDAALRVFDPKRRERDMKPPLSRQDLKARQDRFYADARLRIEREARAGDRRLLVFVQCGKGFDASYLGEPRDYDVLLNYFQDSDANPRADAIVFQAGAKTTAIRRLLDERPDLLMRYQAALFLTTTSRSAPRGSTRCSPRWRGSAWTSLSRRSPPIPTPPGRS